MSSSNVTRLIKEKEAHFECLEKKKILDEVRCSICLEIFNEPYVAKCGHNFCKKCFHTTTLGCYHEDCRVSKCGLCRSDIHSSQLEKSSHIIRNMIDNFEIKCLQEKNGSVCSKILYIGGINHHIMNECENFEISCRYLCGFTGYRVDVVEHEKVCLKNPEVKIDCPQCTENIFAVNLDDHKKNDCPEELVECKFQCSSYFRRCDEEHEKVCLKNPEVKIDCPQCKENIFAVNLNEHKKNDCPEELWVCPYHLCNVKIKRCDMNEHCIKFALKHANKLHDGYTELKKKLTESEKFNKKIIDDITECRRDIKSKAYSVYRIKRVCEFHVDEAFSRLSSFLKK
jgi:RING-type zinc-finger